MKANMKKLMGTFAVVAMMIMCCPMLAFAAEETAEYVPSMYATIWALAFVEAGNCFADIKDYNPFNLKRSAGVGVRLFLPMFGLMGIDWGWGFDPINGSTQYGGSQFHFVLGQEL